MKKLLQQEGRLYLSTFLASIAISLFAFWQHGIINNDGILYIEVARQFVENGLTAAFKTFNWPFYGILIGLIQQLIGLSYETSAHVLNGLLVAILCTAFVAIYRLTGQHGTRPWFAAILILALPVLNDYRELVIRNFGFWAFSLVALFYFIKFSRQQTLGNSTLWQSAAAVATAFRIEGIVFFVAPALFYLLKRGQVAERLGMIFKSSYLLIALGTAGLAIAVYFGLFSGAKQINTLQLWLSYLSPVSIIQGIHAESLKLREQLPYLSSADEATLILSTGLLSLALAKTATNAVLPYLLITAYGLRKHWLDFGEANRIVLLFFALSFLTVLSILASRYFLSSRYTVTAVLFLSLLTFPYVDIAFQKLASMPRRHWHIIAWIVVLLIFLDGVISLQSPKVIIRSGAQWALTNIDQSGPCLSNEERLQFYTEGRCRYISPTQVPKILRTPTANSEWDYLLLWLDRKDQTTKESLKNSPDLQLLKQWESRKGDQVVVYRTAGLSIPVLE